MVASYGGSSVTRSSGAPYLTGTVANPPSSNAKIQIYHISRVFLGPELICGIEVVGPVVITVYILPDASKVARVAYFSLRVA